MMLGQCTTSLLTLHCPLSAIGAINGSILALEEGEYDQVLQHLAAMTQPPDVLILLPWDGLRWSLTEGTGLHGWLIRPA
jgi:hypothetical protein